MPLNRPEPDAQAVPGHFDSTDGLCGPVPKRAARWYVSLQTRPSDGSVLVADVCAWDGGETLCSCEGESAESDAMMILDALVAADRHRVPLVAKDGHVERDVHAGDAGGLPERKFAMQRARDLLYCKLGDLPAPAVSYIKVLVEQLGYSREVYLVALARYAECCEGMVQDDGDYKADPYAHGFFGGYMAAAPTLGPKVDVSGQQRPAQEVEDGADI